MGGDPSRRNQNLYCAYHRDKGHTTEQCWVLKDHLGQLVKAGYLKEFMVESGNKGTKQGAQQRRNPLPPPLGVIEVIHAAPRSTAVVGRRGVLIVAPVGNCSGKQPPKKKMKIGREPIAFNDDDLEGIIQSDDDALVVMARINGFMLKRVMVDQGSGADVMYLDLFRVLRLKKGDLSKYDMPLVGFDGQVAIPEGQISLPVNIEGKEVTVAFIVVTLFSPYTTILGRPWIQAMGAVPSTLHVKVKFRTKQGIAIVRESQQAAKQCLVVVVDWKTNRINRKKPLRRSLYSNYRSPEKE